MRTAKAGERVRLLLAVARAVPQLLADSTLGLAADPYHRSTSKQLELEASYLYRG